MLPQLKVRSEYSYRRAYGPVPRIAERLAEIGCPAAGLVDTHGTWGHVEWEKALGDAGIKPLYGCEFTVPRGDAFEQKPRCWVLAEDIKQFYRLSSANPSTAEELAAATGVIRFAGAALDDPDAFDYIDINPRSIGQTRRALELHRRTGKPLVLTGDNDYPAPDDRLRYLAWNDAEKMTPQHIVDERELRRAMPWVDDETFAAAVRGANEVAERIQATALPRAPMIQFDGDLDALVERGRLQRLEDGHIAQWTEEYQQRLDRELDMIKHKNYESYFLVVADLVNWAKQRMLVGPARGSSAGSLVCFLLGITEVDPLVHGLIFERFIDVNRADLPDIDIDFNDQKRELVFDYLRERYGEDCVARIGNINRLKPRSVMAHAGKKLAIPHGATFSVTNVLIEYSSGDSRYGHGLEDTLENTQPGRDFTERYPESAVMRDLENHASHTGVHAAGIIVSNVPVTEHCTVRDGIAQVEKKAAEALNLLKIDALGLRTLGVIEDAGCVTREQLYGLSFDDPAVLSIFDEAKFSGIFQFEGAAQRRVSVQVPMDDFKRIDHVTALARPGPLGGGAANTYIQRNAGREPVEYRHPSMADYLGETQGVVLYQEQVMRIVREIGGFSWEDTSVIRKAMSGRKGKEFFDRHGERFVEGAAERDITAEDARAIWDEICNFGAWGMNKSHTVSYAMISYWCAYMKCYHPLEYAAACLRSAKDDEQTLEVLRELTSEGVPYVPFDADRSEVNWAAKDGMLVGGYTNLVGIGPVKAAQFVEKRDNGAGLTDKDREKLAAHTIKHHDLTPGRTLWGHIYDDPDSHNIHGPVKHIAELHNKEDAVVIVRMERNERRDENETVRAAKRGGQLKSGQTLFLDMFVVDDSITKPVVARIKPRMWDVVGEKIADRAVPKQDWFLIRGVWLKDFSMMDVRKIKCLSNPEVTS